MIDFTNFEKINDEAYIWRGFLDPDTTDEIFNESEAISNSIHKEVRPGDRVQLLHGDVDSRLVNKVLDFFKDTIYEIRYFLHWHVPRNTWFAIHRDEEAPDPTPMKKAWGGVIYLSDMNGGELFYPVNNTWVKPGKGDLILHTASIAHGAMGVDGDNKRFVTFVVYDITKEVNPDDHPSTEEEALITWKQTMDATEWFNSEIGLKWRKEYNTN